MSDTDELTPEEKEEAFSWPFDVRARFMWDTLEGTLDRVLVEARDTMPPDTIALIERRVELSREIRRPSRSAARGTP